MAETPQDPASLLQENAALKAKLEDYKKLEEDLLARRVFDKARGYLTTWITMGGIILTLAGFVGYKSVVSYFTDLAKKKVDTMTEEEIHVIIQKSVDVRVETGVNRAMPDILEQMNKRLAEIAAPLAGSSTSGATPVASTTAQLNKIDWAADMSPVRNSGDEGSVVGQSLAAMLEFYIFKSAGSRIAISARDIYNEVRIKEGTIDLDSGALIKDGIDFLKKTGAVEESAWPYRPGVDVNKRPPPSLSTAKRHKITDARPISSLNDLKSALKFGPVVTGITIYQEGLQSPETAKTGIVPMPKPKEQVIGGISICIVGYDDSKKLLKFQNSWDSDWGDHGYGYISYDYFRANSGDTWSFRYAGNR
jgi:C1A family cysteine protease